MAASLNKDRSYGHPIQMRHTQKIAFLSGYHKLAKLKQSLNWTLVKHFDDFFFNYFESVTPFVKVIPFDLDSKEMRVTLSKVAPKWGEQVKACKSPTKSVRKNNDELLLLIEEELARLSGE